MSLLASFAVMLRVFTILLGLALVIGRWRICWNVIVKGPNWRGDLASFVFTVAALGGAIICSVNIFPDAGWQIDRNLRLLMVNLGLSMFICSILTSVYRNALRVSHETARKAFLSGLCLILPAAAFVALLLLAGGVDG